MSMILPLIHPNHCLFQVTKEGEVLPFYQQELSIGADGGQDR